MPALFHTRTAILKGGEFWHQPVILSRWLGALLGPSTFYRMKYLIAFLGAAALLGTSIWAAEESAPKAPEKVAPLGTYTEAQRNYWAFVPRKKIVPPAIVSPADKAWVKTPVDAFILTGL